MGEFVRFQSTLWSRISLVKKQDTEAVGQFFHRYLEPVRRFIRNAGFTPQDSEDLAQEVFTRLLADQVLDRADRDRSRFRSFLLGVVRNVVREERRKRRAIKRGSGEAPVSLDAEGVPEPAEPEPAEEEFDRTWLHHLLAIALQGLEQDHAQQYRALNAHTREGKSYEEIASEMDVPLQTVKNLIHRARRRLMELLQKEISRYSSTSEEYEEEIRYLSRFLA